MDNKAVFKSAKTFSEYQKNKRGHNKKEMRKEGDIPCSTQQKS